MLDTVYEWTRTHQTLNDDGVFETTRKETIFCPPSWMEMKVDESENHGVWNTEGAKTTVERNVDGSVDIVLMDPTKTNRTLEHFEPICVDDLADDDDEHEYMLDVAENARTFPYVESVAEDGSVTHILCICEYRKDEHGIERRVDEAYFDLEKCEWVERPEGFWE